MSVALLNDVSHSAYSVAYPLHEPYKNVLGYGTLIEKNLP